jgi:predicted transcriptional regulator
MFVKPEKKNKKGRPRMRWMDNVEKNLKNLKNLGVVNLKIKTQERDGGRNF